MLDINTHCVEGGYMLELFNSLDISKDEYSTLPECLQGRGVAWAVGLCYTGLWKRDQIEFELRAVGGDIC